VSDDDNTIDALLAYMETVPRPDLRANLTALVAEREKLVEDNASQTYKGNSVRYWHDKACAYKATIRSVWEILGSAAVHPDGERTITAALTALVAERDGLKQRVAELEAHPPADRDRELRERDDAMAKWMDQVTMMLFHSMTHSHDAKQELGTRCDAAIAAMRKGEA
jgi:hypothetical protein